MITLEEIRDSPMHEKLRMMATMLKAITSQEAELSAPVWHQDLLVEREQLIKEGKATCIDWEIAKQ